MDKLLAVLTIATAVSAAISAIVLWGFATGRWVQRQEHDKSKIAELELALRREDAQMHAFIERTNTDVGRLDQRLSWLEKEKALEKGWTERTDAALVKRVETCEELLQDVQRELRTGHRREKL